MRLAIILFLAFQTSSAAPYIYPPLIETPPICKSSDVDIQKIRETSFRGYHCPYSDLKVKEFDLNKDGLCEYFITALVDREHTSRQCDHKFTKVVEVKRGRTVTLLEGPNIDQLATERNDYLRLVSQSWGGHRTNIIFTTNVYYYNGVQYVCEFCKDNSAGGYMDLALEAYRAKKFDLAEIYYWNVYAMGLERKLSDANNLALTYIKNGKNMDAERILNKHLSLTDQEIVNAEKVPCYNAYTKCVISKEELEKLKSHAQFNLKLALKNAKND